MRSSIKEKAELAEAKIDSNAHTKSMKDKLLKFFNTPMITLSVNGESMDSPKVFEKGAWCPNAWVIPTYIMKFFILSYVFVNFYTIGNVKLVTKEMVDYNMTSPIP